MVKTISTAKLVQQLGNPAFVLVDVRPMAAFNGWQLQGESRGGHIPGAVPFPLPWTEQMEPAELKQLLDAKGISTDKTIIIYGYTVDDSLAMLNKIKELGCENSLIYDAGVAQWAVDETRPMDRLPNYHKLVHPKWLRNLIAEQPAEPSAGKDFEIFHVSYGAHEEYARCMPE